MRMTKKTGKVFITVLLIFSAAAIVLLLLVTARLAELNDRSEKIVKDMNELKQENMVLQAKCENIMSIEELELYAVNELGMQRVCPCQIFYIDLEK